MILGVWEDAAVGIVLGIDRHRSSICRCQGISPWRLCGRYVMSFNGKLIISIPHGKI